MSPAFDPGRERGMIQVTALRGGMLPRRAGEVFEELGEWYRIVAVTVRLPSAHERDVWERVDYVEVAEVQPIDHFNKRAARDAAETLGEVVG